MEIAGVKGFADGNVPTPDVDDVELRVEVSCRSSADLHGHLEATDDLYIGQLKEKMTNLRMGEQESATDYCNRARQILAEMCMVGADYSTVSYITHVVKGSSEKLEPYALDDGGAWHAAVPCALPVFPSPHPSDPLRRYPPPPPSPCPFSPIAPYLFPPVTPPAHPLTQSHAPGGTVVRAVTCDGPHSSTCNCTLVHSHSSPCSLRTAPLATCPAPFPLPQPSP
ncbi:unnamed protein product [Closterium sp. NIES-53]